MLVFFLGKLIIQRATAEFCRKELVEYALDVAANECDSLTSELAKASNVAEMAGEAERFPLAATRLRIDCPVVVGFDIEQQFGRAGEEAGEAECRHFDVKPRHAARSLDHREV